jgi:hypothetical protein
MRTGLILRAAGRLQGSGRLTVRRAATALSLLPVALCSLVVVPASTALAIPGSEVPIGAATVVSGIITRDGMPVPNADINVLAWPSPEFLAELPGGAKFQEKLLAQESSGPEGGFAVSVELDSLDKEHISDAGSVDFALIVGDSQYQIRWSFTATRATGTQNLWSNPRVAPSLLSQRDSNRKAPTRLSIDLGENARVVEEGNEPDKWVGNDGRPLGIAKGLQAARVARESRAAFGKSAGAQVGPLACGTWVAVDEYQYARTERFVQAIGTGNARPTVDQEVGTQHTMGIAYDSGTGSWSQSGSLSLSFGASAETTYGAGASLVYNKVNYRKYEQFCAWLWHYQWRPSGYYALNSGYGPLITPYWSNCTNYYSGTYTKSQGTNVVFSAGVTLTMISVTAQAQFTNQTKLSWNFTGSGKLCGSSVAGWVSAPEAGAYPL